MDTLRSETSLPFTAVHIKYTLTDLKILLSDFWVGLIAGSVCQTLSIKVRFNYLLDVLLYASGTVFSQIVQSRALLTHLVVIFSKIRIILPTDKT